MTDHPYKATEDGIVHIRDSKNGKVEDIISNFTATIARDITLDDGAESVRVFEIEATKGARTYTFNVPAERFAAMNWAIEHIGARREGILRNHMIMHDGHYRDTVIYSITLKEWPDKKKSLRLRLL